MEQLVTLKMRADRKITVGEIRAQLVTAPDAVGFAVVLSVSCERVALAVRSSVRLSSGTLDRPR